jgi:transglutaminase-like putative cysteine protease
VLIPVVQQGRREHHLRSLRGSGYSLEAQGEKTSFVTGFLLPALILVLIAALMYLVIPKPLHEPSDVFRKLSTPRNSDSQTDLGEELPEPLNDGRSGVGEGMTSPGGDSSGQDGSSGGSAGQDGSTGGSAGQDAGGGDSSGQDGSSGGSAGQDGGGGSMRFLLFEVECAASYPLRLKAFERLDNGVWRSSTDGYLYRSDDTALQITQVQDELEGREMRGFFATDIAFFMRVPLGREMPAATNPVTVYLGEEQGPPYSLYIDADDNLYTGEDMEGGYTYGMTAMLPLGVVPEDGVIPPEISQRYARAYGGIDGLAEMAEQATAGRNTQAGKVEALLDYISENFIYDPSISLEPGGANLERYINGDHRGDAELAATAMTLFCRELGIPARPVLGFIPEVFNEETGRFEVYNMDMYYWVEVYFSNCGWLSCMPVPRIEEGTDSSAVSQHPQEDFNFHGGGGTTTEAGETTERPGTAENQIEKSMDELESGSQPSGSSAPEGFSEENFRRTSKIMLISMSALLALLLLFLGGRALWSWLAKKLRRGRKAKDEAVRGASLARDQGRFIYLTYKRMCEELAEVGLARRKSETPGEFLTRVKGAYPSAVQYAAPISGALEDNLYGMRPIDVESLRRLDNCLLYLRKLCQGIKSSSSEAWR